MTVRVRQYIWKTMLRAMKGSILKDAHLKTIIQIQKIVTSITTDAVPYIQQTHISYVKDAHSRTIPQFLQVESAIRMRTAILSAQLLKTRQTV